MEAPEAQLAALLSRSSPNLFFPRKDSFEANNIVTCRDGVKLYCHYIRENTDSTAKTIVYFHGTGELVSGYLNRPVIEGLPDIANVLKEMGLNTFFVEYRGYGACTDSPPDLILMLNDVEDIFQALLKELPPEQIIVFGRSMGGLFTIHASHVVPNAAGIILESALSDLDYFLEKRVNLEELGTTMEELRKASSLCVNLHGKLAEYTGKVLILHCEDDKIVLLQQGQDSYDLSTKAASRHTAFFKTGGHNYIWPMNWKEYSAAVEKFVVECGHTVPPRKPEQELEESKEEASREKRCTVM